jgi:hypothetical protein
MISLISEDNKVLVVRECSEANCIVVEKYTTGDDEEPIQTIDIPADIADLVAKAIVAIRKGITNDDD